MKKTFIKISALSISLLVLATACTKTGATGPAGANGANGATGPAGPVLTGTLQGEVFLYDASGVKQLSATIQAGDSVILTNNSNGSVMKTATNATGGYSFSNLTTGTYSLTVSKAGYGSVISSGVQFAGGGVDYRNYQLGLIPTGNVTGVVAVDTNYAAGGSTSTAENYVKVRGYVPVTAGGSTVIIYVSNATGTSASSVIGSFSSYYTTTVAAGSNSFKITIPTASLYDLGFVSGNTVYFAAYILNGNTSASSYADATTAQTVFTAVSSTPVVFSAAVQ